jgi:hypothetical protein
LALLSPYQQVPQDTAPLGYLEEDLRRGDCREEVEVEVEVETDVEVVEVEVEVEGELPLQEGKQQAVNHTSLQPSMAQSLKFSMGIMTTSRVSIVPSRSSGR